MTNPDGVTVPFGADDIKALLSYYYGFVHRATDTFQMGRRCFDRGGPRGPHPDCDDDLNAGAFHVVLANRIGIDQKGLIADLQRFEEVWNHPITAYRTEIRRRGPRRIAVRTTLNFIDGNGHDWHPVLATPNQLAKSIAYDYALELDAAGMITGGSWISRERPDFLWLMGKVRRFGGSLPALGLLLDE
jgi:hypothetical protein